MTSAVPDESAVFVDDYLEEVAGIPPAGRAPGSVNSGPGSDVELFRVNPGELERLSKLLDSAVEVIEDLSAVLGSGDSVVRFPGCRVAQASAAVAELLNTASVAAADRIAYMSGVARGSAGDYRIADGAFAAKLVAVGNLR